MAAATNPFALAPTRFPVPGLAAAAARAPLGGAREALLGTLLVARLATGLGQPHPLPVEVRRVRAAGAKSWLTALAVPTKMRSVLQRAIGASAEEDPQAMAEALDAVTDITAPHLDRAARSDLERLTAALRQGPDSLAARPHAPVE